jgi:hypothetical protein
MACECTSPPVWLGTTELTNLHVNLNPGPGLMLGQATSWRPGGAAGPAPRHQPAESGKAIHMYCDYCITCKHAGSVVVQAAGCYAHDRGFPALCIFFFFVFLVHGKVKLYMPCMYTVYTWSKHVFTQTYIQIPVYSCMYTVWTLYEWNTCIHYCIYVFVHDTYMAWTWLYVWYTYLYMSHSCS